MREGCRGIVVAGALLGGGMAASGCADPCIDDGFGQGDCPAGATEGGSGTASGTATTDGQTASHSGTVTMGSESHGGTATMGSGSQSGTVSAGTMGTSESGTTMGLSASGSGSGTVTDSATSMVSDSASSSSTGIATVPYCVDADGDGFGDPSQCMPVDPQNPPPGTVPADAGFDCDDSDPNTFPGAAPLDDPMACMHDGDGDDYGDNQPLPGVDPGTDCDDTDIGIQICALLVTQDGTANHPYDQGLVSVLDPLGFSITVVADTDTDAGDADGMTVVVVSETAQSTDVGAKFRDVTVPVVCLEGLIWDDMEMAPEGNPVGTLDVDILAAGGPLAGGLMGTVTVVQNAGSGTFWTNPGANAVLVASRTGQPTQIVDFAFDEGDTMEGMFMAPARRVGLGYDADQGPSQFAAPTDDGLTLFEAAVVWATE